MRLRILAFTLLCVGLNVVSVAKPASADQPDPSVGIVSCVVGGETVLSWKHARVEQIQLNWYDASGALRAITTSDNPRGSRLSLTTPSVVDDGGSVDGMVFFAGGLGAQLAPFPCST